MENHIKKVAVVGVSHGVIVPFSPLATNVSQAGGQSGKYITEELLNGGKHKVTALTRADSTSEIPEGAEIAKIDYADHASLVKALRGQDALVITMNVRAPPDQQTKLIDAAAEAAVPWILPNEWGYDNDHPGLAKDIAPVGENALKVRQYIEKVGKSSWIVVSCGFWYEYSLSFGPQTFGFDLKNRSVTFYDDGNTHINTSTLRQCGRSAAKLLALKISPDDENDKSPCLEHYKNKSVHVSSFNVSQKDMLESVMRVTGSKLEEWKIEHEPSTSRYKAGVDAMMKGDYLGFAQMMYARVFFQDGSGEPEKSKGLQNDVLGLPKEDLDEATKLAIDRSEKGLVAGKTQ